MIIERAKQKLFILVLIAVAAVVNVFNGIDYFIEHIFPIYDQMLAITIIFLLLSQVFENRRKYATIMGIGQAILLFLCACLYYSRTFIDFTTFIFCVYSTLCTISYCQTCRREMIK